jgi:UDP-N-acetyl-D-mannosaminuronic acid dehydrogenase
MKDKLSHISIKKDANLRETMSAMERNKPSVTGIPSGIALITDDKNVLLGIVTDGDLRKAISKGVDLGSSVSNIMNKTPLVIQGDQSPRQILSYVADKSRDGKWDRAHFDKLVFVDENFSPTNVVALYDLWKSSDARYKQIGVVGLGYVGLTLAVTLADLGFTVRGYDTNPAVVKSTKRGEPHFFEKGLHKMLKDHLDKNFTVVNGFEGKHGCDVYFIAVGTPIKKGDVDLVYIKAVAEYLSKVIKSGDLVILRSTVPLGTTRDVVIPILEKGSKLKVGEDFLVAFAPERTIEGKAIEELRSLPQVVGGYNYASTELASNIFSIMTKSIVPVDSLEEAEMVKLVNNTYRDVTFAFANEISIIARKWNLNTKKVIEAANLGYERSSVPFPSPGVGGYCLEKDPLILMGSAKTKGHTSHLFKHARMVSDVMLDSIEKDITKFVKKNKIKPQEARICILGFAFKGKPATSDVRGSTTYGLIDKLRKNGFKHISGYDPYVQKFDIQKANVKHLTKLDTVLGEHDIIVIMNNNTHFAELDMRSHLEHTDSQILLVDTWSLYSRDDISKLKHVTHYRL